MIALISPAKKLDFSKLASKRPHTAPEFQEQAQKLVRLAQALSQDELAGLMKLSPKLAALNAERFQAFATPFTPTNAKQAVLAYNGDTYAGLDAKNLTVGDLKYAQNHLRILSGLFGLLRPLDLIQPYRLEMGVRLKNPEGKNLYDFWGSALSETVDRAVQKHKEPVVINLASNEYSKAVSSLKSRVITPVFKEIKNDTPKVVGLFAKRARGAMARYLVVNRIEASQKLKGFAEGGYAYQQELSDPRTWVFTRPG